MKRFFITFCCLIGAMIAVFAQDSYTLVIKDDANTATATTSAVTTQKAWSWSDRPGSLSFTIGAPSLTTMIVTAGDSNRPHYHGSYSIRYDYNILRWLAVGGRLSYDGASYTNSYYNDNTWTSYRDVFQYGSIQMEALFTYINREHVQLYSGISLGLMYYFEKAVNYNTYTVGWNSNLMIAGGIIPIGVRVGGRKAYGMAEVSIGTEAMMSLGFGFHL